MKDRTVERHTCVVLAALLDGPIVAFDRTVCKPNGTLLRRGLVMDTTELYAVIRLLANRGIVVERTDAGNLPTWELKTKEQI